MRPAGLRRLVLALVVLAGLVAAGAVPSSAAARGRHGRVLLVCATRCPKPPRGTTYFPTVASAVAAARNGDWVLVWPGTYRENVDVTTARGLTDGLHLRGMDRNRVVLDGTGLDGSGVHVIGVKHTWVENMTGQHYPVNAFYWTGVDGYHGDYLTAYANGDYGVYAYDSNCTDWLCTFAFDYGSWNADSGIYVGGCRDCHAVVTNSKAEKNALGYSGTNAGGELYLVNSEWDHNAAGIVPNTLQSEPDYPQRGAVIYGNYVHDNNDLDVPGSGIAGQAAVGSGIEIAGGWSNIVRSNVIAHQKHYGVFVHWLITPAYDNQVVANRFVDDAYAGGPGDADISLEGTSVQNCVSGNVRGRSGSAPATTDPPNLGGMDECGADNPSRSGVGKGIYGPGNPVSSVMLALNAEGITEPRDFKGNGPHPEAQRGMANPCAGVPDSAWCRHGRLAVRL